MDLLLTEYNYPDYFFMAHLACEAKRYHEAYPIILTIMETELNYTEELINLIQLCFKNILTPLRDSLLILNTFLAKMGPSRIDSKTAAVMKTDTLDKLKHYLSIKDRIDIKIQYSGRLDDPTYVLLKRLKADFCRYSYEALCDASDRKELDEAEEAYEQVYEFVVKRFKPISEEVLSITLNYCVFIDKYRNNRIKAIDLATSRYIRAQTYLGRYSIELDEKPGRIIKLLQKNISVWQKIEEGK